MRKPFPSCPASTRRTVTTYKTGHCSYSSRKMLFTQNPGDFTLTQIYVNGYVKPGCIFMKRTIRDRYLSHHHCPNAKDITDYKRKHREAKNALLCPTDHRKLFLPDSALIDLSEDFTVPGDPPSDAKFLMALLISLFFLILLQGLWNNYTSHLLLRALKTR
jgi:hypothetical protein